MSGGKPYNGEWVTESAPYTAFKLEECETVLITKGTAVGWTTSLAVQEQDARNRSRTRIALIGPHTAGLRQALIAMALATVEAVEGVREFDRVVTQTLSRPIDPDYLSGRILFDEYVPKDRRPIVATTPTPK